MTCGRTWNTHWTRSVPRFGGGQRRFLFTQLVRRDIERRYKATAGGMFWAVAQPLLMIGIYTLVFGVIFRPRWPSTTSPWDYVLILFLGKIPYLFASETLSQSSNAIAGHANLVKRAVFPLQLLPGVSLASSLYHASIALLIWCGLFVAVRGELPLAAPLLVVVWAPLMLFVLAAGWFVAALGAYFRDTVQIVAFANLALMFLSPIFYPVDSAPGLMGRLMLFNPLTFAIEQSRAILLFDGSLDVSGLAVQSAIAAVVAVAALRFFKRVRPGFADAI